MSSLWNSIKKDLKDIWNVPNVLTMLRFVLVVVFAVLFAGRHYVGAVFTFLLAAATDLLDGYIARKTGTITTFGKLMDPLADKIMLIVALICMVSRGYLPSFILAFVLMKEALMIVGGLWLYEKKIVVYAKGFGKAATLVFNTAVVLSILGRAFPTFAFLNTYHVDVIAFVIAIILAICALIQYATSVYKQWCEKR